MDSDILSKLIEYFIAVEVYMKEDGDGPTPLVKKQYVYPEAEDQDFFNNISLFAFPSEKTYDDNKISFGKEKNRNDVFKDSSKDHYDITEVNVSKLNKKSCLDEVKCHDFILTNQYGEKVYASCIRTRKIPLKWDVNVEKDTEYEKIPEIEKGERPRRSYHVPYNTDNTGESDYSLDNISAEHISSFSPFTEYGSRFGNKINEDEDETLDNKPLKSKEKFLKVPQKKRIIDETFNKCKKNKQFSASYNALSKIPTLPTSSLFLTSSIRNSVRALAKTNEGDLLGHSPKEADHANKKVSKSGISHPIKKTNAVVNTITVTASSSKNNSQTILNSPTSNSHHSSSKEKSHNSNKNSFLTLNQLKPKSYYKSDPENINSSTACILSQYTNIKPYTPSINNINSSSYYIDHYSISRSNLVINSSNLINTCSRSYYNINGGGGMSYQSQIRRCSNKFNGSNVYNYTQSTSNLNASNDQLVHSYNRNEFGSNRLYPKNNNNFSSMEANHGSGGLQPLHEYEDDYNEVSNSILDSLNIDFISMENLATEKMLQKQQTNQSLLYNLDLCVNGSLFSMSNGSVNSLFSKKTVTSYILISRRPIFSIMQKCLLEMYLLSKYSLHKNKNKSHVLNPKLLKEGIMESFLAYLMHTIFLPSLNSPFIVEIELPLSKEVVQILPQNKIEIRPLYHPVFTLFQLLSISNIITIFTHMTLEKSVIFYSENPSILTAICESFLSFLEPLEWRMVYIPIVPESVIESLQEAPITFIMGYINSSGNDNLDSLSSSNSNSRLPNAVDTKNSKNNSTLSNEKGRSASRPNQDTIDNFRMSKSEEEILYVNLDTDELSNLSEQRLRLPYESRLRNDLRQIIYEDFPSLQKEIYFNSNHEYTIKTDECAQKIRKCFYHWFVTILYNYQSFYINDGDFNISAFRSRFTDSCIDYINRFTETSMFTHFIEKKYFEKTSLLSSSSIKPRDYFDFCSNKLLGIPYFDKSDKISMTPELNTLKYGVVLLNPPRKEPPADVKSPTIYGHRKDLSPKRGNAGASPKSNREVLGLDSSGLFPSNGDLESSLFSLNTSGYHSKLKSGRTNNNETNINVSSYKFENNDDGLYHFDVNTFEFFNTKYQNNPSTLPSVKNNKITHSFPLLFNNINRLIDLQISYCKALNSGQSTSPSKTSTISPTSATSTSSSSSKTAAISPTSAISTSSSTRTITISPTSNASPTTPANKGNEKENELLAIESTISNTYHALKEILPLASFEGGYSSSHSTYDTQSNIALEQSNSVDISALQSKLSKVEKNQHSGSVSSVKSLPTTVSGNSTSLHSKDNSLSQCQSKSLSICITKSNSALPLSYRFRLQQLLWIRGLLLQEYSLDIFQSIQDFCWAYNFCTNETLLEMIENSFLQLSNHQKCRLFNKLNKNFFLAFDKIFSFNIDIKTMYEAYIQCTNME